LTSIRRPVAADLLTTFERRTSKGTEIALLVTDINHRGA
jgi:hypothetical protein